MPTPRSGRGENTAATRATPSTEPDDSSPRPHQSADERLVDKGCEKLLGLLAAGDPKGEVATAWHAKEVVRSVYTLDNEIVARAFVERLGEDLQDESSPPEVRSLGRTLLRWKDQIIAWHEAHFTNECASHCTSL